MDRDFARRYGDLVRWHWWFRGREAILSTLLTRELGVPSAPRRIASIGCGPLEGLRWLVPHAGKGGVVAGVDSDPAGVIRAASVPGVTFTDGDALTPNLEPRSFDAVLLLDVLEHLDDDAAALRTAATLLKPGALLVVSVPAHPSLWGVQDVVSEHKRRYTRRTLADAYARAGLSRPRFAHANTLLFPPIAAVRWFRRVVPSRKTSDFDGAAPGVVNDVLGRVFASERHLVGRVPLPWGVSLLGWSRESA